MKNENAKKISDVINSCIDEIQVGTELSTDHRFLQGVFFKVALHFMANLAKSYEKGRYDDRNEFACKASYEVIKNLEEKGLFAPKFFERYYEEALTRMEM